MPMLLPRHQMPLWVRRVQVQAGAPMLTPLPPSPAPQVVFTPDRIAFLAPSIAITTGTFAGHVADAHGIVGALVAPSGGVVSVLVDGAPWVFAAGTIDVTGDNFVSGDDYDRWMDGWKSGYVGCDYLSTGFVNGDSFDAFVADWQAGQ